MSILSQGITTTTKTLIMNKEKRYSQNKEKLLAYAKEKVVCLECECYVGRTSLARHRKSKKHIQAGERDDGNKVLCECGTLISKQCLIKHRKTKLHIQLTEGKVIETSEEEKKDVRDYYREYYEKNKENLNKKITCECGDVMVRSSFDRHLKTKLHKKRMTALENQHKKKVGQGADPNSIEWFLEGYDGSESEEEEEEIVLEKGTFTKDIVFQCSGCYESIVRDSKKHDECILIKNVWVCGDCYLSI